MRNIFSYTDSFYETNLDRAGPGRHRNYHIKGFLNTKSAPHVIYSIQKLHIFFYDFMCREFGLFLGISLFLKSGFLTHKTRDISPQTPLESTKRTCCKNKKAQQSKAIRFTFIQIFTMNINKKWPDSQAAPPRPMSVCSLGKSCRLSSSWQSVKAVILLVI